MAVSPLILKTGYVSSDRPRGPDYAPSSTEPKKAAIVKTMRFTNLGSAPAKLNAWFQKGGGPFCLGCGARMILPLDQYLPPLWTCVEDDELTLDSGDGLYFQVDVGASVEFVLCGIEQDVV